MALLNAAEAATTSTQTWTAGASAQILAANSERSGLRITMDPAAAGPIYILLGSGTASATNFHIALSQTNAGYWDGRISDTVWRGAVQVFGTGAKFGVVEV